MLHRVTVLPEKQNIEAATGTCLLDVLRKAGMFDSAPCGGSGTCGKCKVTVDGQEVLACQTRIDRDITVALPQKQVDIILTAGVPVELLPDSGICLAIDIGTTTVAAYLIENGQILSTESRKNPQAAFGADVVSRIRHAVSGQRSALTCAIRHCAEDITQALLSKTGKYNINRVCIVGNPAMQQLFLGLPVNNLVSIPFHPVLTKTQVLSAGDYLSVWEGAQLLVVPDIAAYIGADTVAGILATGMDQTEKLTLLVDIGTNGEMVLGKKDRLVACATAAGPALEGSGIQFGMQAADGAIAHVEKDFFCHVIGKKNAVGICGSGLLDAVAVSLERGLVNTRGRILKEEQILPLADDVYLTQEDIRQLQQAKGAIAAGIQLMAAHLGVCLSDIETVYLAGAFGTFMDPHSACRIGLIPEELESKIQPVGNAAGSGAMQIVCSPAAFARTAAIVSAVEHLDLAVLPGWAKCFAKSMRFATEEEYWCKKALSLGFSFAVPMDTAKLKVREDVRAMCAADKCGAYGKNWTCPPHCGTLESCQQQLHSFERGILVQTVGHMQKSIDSRAYRQTETRHLQQFYALAAAIRKQYPSALCLGSGGCRVCSSCAFPDACRFPEKACSSMEGYGLFVTQVCRDHGVDYHHGDKTVTYTACIAF